METSRRVKSPADFSRKVSYLQGCRFLEFSGGYRFLLRTRIEETFEVLTTMGKD